MSDPSKERIRRFLKQKVDIKLDKAPTEQEKQDFIKRKLYSQTPEATNQQKSYGNFWQKLNQRLNLKERFLDGASFKSFRKETIPMLAFVSFASFILYHMQTEQDRMVRSVVKVKTQKQEMLENEDLYIRTHLVPKHQLGQNQIQDVPDVQGKYKFEKYGEFEDDDDEGDFNTKEDFLDLLRKDFNKGKGLPEQYQQDVMQYAQQHGKKLRYGEFEDEGGDDEEEDKTDYIMGNTKRAQAHMQQAP